jgi:hypothetical protein
MQSQSAEITVNSAVVAGSLAAIALLLNGISFTGQLIKYILGYDINRFLPLFDVSLELNIPTFFSLLILLFASLLLLIIALLQAKQQKHDVSKWLILSLGFLYIAYDDGFQVHEDLVGMIRPMLWNGNLGVFYYAWIIPVIPMVFILALFFWKFLFRLPSVTRITFVLAAICYLGGSIGFEMIGGYYDELHGGFNSLTYNLISTMEETMEMIGVIIFIYGLLVYLGSNFQTVQFRCGPSIQQQTK